MINRWSIAGTAALLFVLAPAVAFAQARAPAAGGFEVVCPPTLDLTYTQVASLPIEWKLSSIDGFRHRVAPAVVRLIASDVAPPANDKNELQGGMADNAQDAAPNEPLVFTLRAEGEKDASFASAVTCSYEGGYSLQHLLPTTTLACTLRARSREAAATETSTRSFLTSAVYACR